MSVVDFINTFRIQAQDAIDSRFVLADAEARYTYPLGALYEGLVTYQQDAGILYVLTDIDKKDTDAGWSRVTEDNIISAVPSATKANGYRDLIFTFESGNTITVTDAFKDGATIVSGSVTEGALTLTDTNGNSFTVTGSVQGDKGDKGDQGETGTAGAQGERGLQGMIGAQGEPGNTGADGAMGTVGPKGETGARGMTGLNGSDGEAVSNVTGTTNANGDTVATFGTDSDSNIGSVTITKGVQGVRGPDGPRGIQGEQGETGAMGDQANVTKEAVDNAIGSATHDYYYRGDHTWAMIPDPTKGQIDTAIGAHATGNSQEFYSMDGQWRVPSGSGGGSGGGTNVVANPNTIATDTLNTIEVGTTTYNLPSGSGGSTDLFHDITKNGRFLDADGVAYLSGNDATDNLGNIDAQYNEVMYSNTTYYWIQNKQVPIRSAIIRSGNRNTGDIVATKNY